MNSNPLNGEAPSDWPTAVEQAVAAEFRRRRAWTRWAIGGGALAGAVALALLAAQLAKVPAQTRAIAGEVATGVAERITHRQVAPMRKTDAEIYANQVALARHQIDMDQRLGDLEAEAARLQRLLAHPPAEPVAASRSQLARQQARIDALERRLRQLERDRPAAGATPANGR